ncbi:MAG: helix-turn-helix transcriptional regulator [Brevundimonas sp.]|uniref:helix-turn-helix domain-containing protein n=1 Tax=Brevundimonas sp. TaxID=1871086 RepID=UPI00263A086A|nr:helix-turn-helix transcriptional regulator [Brevundimonas sp.]MDI6623204.1 helix-turn-helix transcriptional regulator [Brevundimonas sp.]MDQ7811356.1 helix-turn-helix transcriptional regulator [Brevundimonas sp.]
MSKLGAQRHGASPVTASDGRKRSGWPLWRSKRGLPASEAPALSQREAECLAWVSRGKSSSDIGAILGLSPRTLDSDHDIVAAEHLQTIRRVRASIFRRHYWFS